ncbi:dTDP-4-dehydrorhamnose 3,5-epimerase [Myroides marinus]|uniref:dTDP-4-dehydrorhamnose 3,5-epimerase n=1 Tax=Myroides marinus TaxID=703342 RepID=UPI0025786FDE|nr:dTDP-4-dehydrorhamnose 3,5-epimerase [Myroides marinus]MDM1348018.1 dTDP-4-dehydrorhamnose 3,5-epimerase [Myroides marinus]MDM1350733.1 dTDP-4-dehydrorhamnose 3,5-epimerase [Myroides marinus]MDM1354521.1 dTDP-4-dehydrorhamnose 3,5-epimerase [Myroides marinus]MDM1357940.1 dTDP-4-dehydrorhamnose 3,5-epimerase [Myroides marinus]MDM1365343.1 dTDP-4-dehydrorhamnose 3,5-epimerase [Myroides marinus]
MKVFNTPINECIVIEPKVFFDERGYFFESFNERVFEEKTGLNVRFIQDNQSKSSKGVLRGLHYQRGEYQQAKLVRVLQGEVLDVVLDLRKDSSTYGKHFTQVLSDENFTQVYIPRGCAHGFIVKSETAIFSYKCDNVYNKESEGGIIYNDPSLGIDWEYDLNEVIVSNKDKDLPLFINALPI